MDTVRTLIAQGVEKCYPQTQAELARRIGAKPQEVNDWKSGRKRMPIARFAQVAEIATGSGPESWQRLWEAVKQEVFRLLSSKTIALAQGVR